MVEGRDLGGLVEGREPSGLVVDLVDRLSTPIQFMSLAEKRTKQMKGMGFDENDISDEAVTSSASVKQRPKQEQVAVLPAATAAGNTNGRATATPQPRTASSTPATSQQTPATTDKKEKKGRLSSC